MLQDAHTSKTSIPVVAVPGVNIVIAGSPDKWIYIHELMGDLDVNGTLTITCGTDVEAQFVLDAGQGITEGDEPGMDGVPRFQCAPGENFILTLSAGSTFRGTCDYSERY